MKITNLVRIKYVVIFLYMQKANLPIFCSLGGMKSLFSLKTQSSKPFTRIHLLNSENMTMEACMVKAEAII